MKWGIDCFHLNSQWGLRQTAGERRRKMALGEEEKKEQKTTPKGNE